MKENVHEEKLKVRCLKLSWKLYREKKVFFTFHATFYLSTIHHDVSFLDRVTCSCNIIVKFLPLSNSNLSLVPTISLTQSYYRSYKNVYVPLSKSRNTISGRVSNDVKLIIIFVSIITS